MAPSAAFLTLSYTTAEGAATLSAAGASADLKEAMTKAGVVDTPTIYFLESID